MTREEIILDCQKLYNKMGKLRSSGHPNDSRLAEALFYYIRYEWNNAELEHKT